MPSFSVGFFNSVAKHLAPQGRLLFDVFVPSLRLLTLAPDDRQLVGRFPHPTLGEVTLEETIVYVPLCVRSAGPIGTGQPQASQISGRTP